MVSNCKHALVCYSYSASVLCGVPIRVVQSPYTVSASRTERHTSTWKSSAAGFESPSYPIKQMGGTIWRDVYYQYERKKVCGGFQLRSLV